MAKRILMRSAALLSAVALPFLLLTRVATWLYLERGWSTWFALAGAAGVTVLVTSLVGALVALRLTGRLHLAPIFKWVALPLVVVYCGQALLYFSAAHAKTARVRSHYRALHPLMRLSLSTWVLADGDLVVTDAERALSDYQDMGLPPYPRSRHLAQADGYVHAVDLRTIGRPEWRNWLTERYFRTLGFGTLRHVGTADHLHVSLPPRTHP